MAIVWSLLALFLGSALFVGGAVRRAPDGYEDQEGFHLGQPPSTSFGVTSSETEFIPEPSQHVA
jgi:hypothetical protein